MRNIPLLILTLAVVVVLGTGVWYITSGAWHMFSGTDEFDVSNDLFFAGTIGECFVLQQDHFLYEHPEWPRRLIMESIRFEKNGKQELVTTEAYRQERDGLTRHLGESSIRVIQILSKGMKLRVRKVMRRNGFIVSSTDVLVQTEEPGAGEILAIAGGIHFSRQVPFGINLEFLAHCPKEKTVSPRP